VVLIIYCHFEVPLEVNRVKIMKSGGVFLNKEEIMQKIIDRINKCDACRLAQTRTNVVPGEGNINSPIIFVGEGPGEEEDKTGRPFVGRAGKLFDKILESVNLERKNVYIANIVKCRPPKNRVPLPDEVEACSPFLMAQIETINPKVIVPLGATAMKFFLGNDVKSITAARGKLYDWKSGIKIFPMFHPSYLLRNASKAPGSPKYLTWEDIKKLKKMYDEFTNQENEK
jgi:uracil-DNA glycosylase family 4